MTVVSQYEVVPFERWHGHNESRFESDPEFSSLGPSTFRYLAEVRPALKTVVVEADYVDPDYSAAYSYFYSAVFRPPPRTCTRALFFSEDFEDISSVTIQKVAESFKGFLVIWPTDPPVIGRSILPFPAGSSDEQVSVMADYQCHVAGVTLTMKTAMFASKDHGVSACATIATWLATDLMHRRFRTRSCSSAEITLLATSRDPKWGRPLPQTYGLDIQQITRALASLDYAPYVYYLDRDLRVPVAKTGTWIGILYGYILSGIPIIIFCNVQGRGSHAVLAVGFNKKLILPPEKKAEGITGSKSFSRAVESVIIHDDRFGAFGKIIPDPGGTLHARAEYENGVSNIIEITAMIAPLPIGVNLLSGESHRLGMRYLRQHFSDVLQEPAYEGPFQTSLKQSVEFKKETYYWPSEFKGPATRIRELAMPEWIWVTEAFLENHDSVDNKGAVARVILDASQLRFNEKDIFIGGHLFHTFLP